jgi:hypothetical protein
VAVEKVPEEALVFLLASRFCDSDRLLDLAWTLARVQAICDFVNSGLISATSTPGSPGRRRKPIRKVAGSAATMRIWRSRSAGRAIFVHPGFIPAGGIDTLTGGPQKLDC